MRPPTPAGVVPAPMFPPDVSLAFAIMHAAFAEARGPLLQQLTGALESELTSIDRLHVERDETRRGTWSVAKACLNWATSQPVSHVVLMNDDAVPCPAFVETIRAALAVRSDDVVSFYANDETELDAREAGEAWWTSSDGVVSVCVALPRARVMEFLGWVSSCLTAEAEALTDDVRFDLWAMAHERLIWHGHALVEHGAPAGSLTGSDAHAHRTSAGSPPASAEAARAIDWTKGASEPFHAGLLHFFPSPCHLLRYLTRQAQLDSGIDRIVDTLWGDEAEHCRALFLRNQARGFRPEGA